MSTLISDLKVLSHLTLRRNRGRTHQERLERFYDGQATHYDDFRKKLLTGRESLVAEIPTRHGDRWVEMGGGTGATLEFLGTRLGTLGEVYLVDLCDSLLEVARQRIASRGWDNVSAVCADATRYTPPEPADVVLFSYSLTMIPDWFAAIERACEILRPGGHIGVVDFYVSRRHADPPRIQHGWLTRTGWPTWFAMDNVFLSGDHLAMLQRKFETVSVHEGRAKIPYLPLVRVPVYRFVGRKRD
jgi:S-adenosylmethionine-diacylgycerolhomoserine-N-methlytransferase